MKKYSFLLLLFFLSLISTETVFGEVLTGYCGGNNTVIYNYDTETSVLIISGTGNMVDYSESGGYRAPWWDLDIEKAIIENGITTIGQQAFNRCSYLTELTIGSSVERMGEDVFAGCTSLTKIDVNSQNTFFSSENGVLYDNGKTMLIKCPAKKRGSLTIPNTVHTICDEAFYDCSRLSNLSIPGTVTTIGKYAFYRCTSLTSADLCSVTDIGVFAFQYCSNLTSISLSNTITSIEDYVFADCIGLTSFTIPNSVKKIRAQAFLHCQGLKSISIPSSVVSIGEDAFYGCNGLTDINIDAKNIGTRAFGGCSNLKNIILGNTVNKIGTWAFFEIEELQNIVIPNSVTTVESAAFYGCSKLKNIVIGDSVDEIGGIFGNCYSLTDIILLSTTPPWIYSYSFNTGNANTVIHVPEGCKETYLASQDIWKNFTIVEGNYNFEAVDAEGNSIGRKLDYDDDGNNTLTLPDTYQSLTVPQDIPLKQISYERNFGNTNWQSLYVPFEIPVTEELLEDFDLAYINAARQYDYDDDGTIDELTIEIFKVKSGTLRANHPYLIRAKETGMKTITVDEATLYATKSNSVDCSTTSLSFTFTGAYETLAYDNLVGCRLLGSGKWNTPSATATMKPMRFYLKIASRGSEQVLPAASSATPIRMTVWGEDGEATDIQSLLLPEGTGEASRYFDLQGREVEHPERGIYIINGKKVLVQ